MSRYSEHFIFQWMVDFWKANTFNDRIKRNDCERHKIKKIISVSVSNYRKFYYYFVFIFCVVILTNFNRFHCLNKRSWIFFFGCEQKSKRKIKANKHKLLIQFNTICYFMRCTVESQVLNNRFLFVFDFTEGSCSMEWKNLREREWKKKFFWHRFTNCGRSIMCIDCIIRSFYFFCCFYFPSDFHNIHQMFYLYSWQPVPKIQIFFFFILFILFINFHFWCFIKVLLTRFQTVLIIFYKFFFSEFFRYFHSLGFNVTRNPSIRNQQ